MIRPTLVEILNGKEAPPTAADYAAEEHQTRVLAPMCAQFLTDHGHKPPRDPRECIAAAQALDRKLRFQAERKTVPKKQAMRKLQGMLQEEFPHLRFPRVNLHAGMVRFTAQDSTGRRDLFQFPTSLCDEMELPPQIIAFQMLDRLGITPETVELPRKTKDEKP